MIAKTSKFDSKVTAVMFLALFGFLLAPAMPVTKLTAVAQESFSGIRVWRGASQEPAFGEAAQQAREAPAAEVSTSATASQTPAVRQRRGSGVRFHGGRVPGSPAAYRPRRAGQPKGGVPLSQRRHRAGGYPIAGRINQRWNDVTIRTRRGSGVYTRSTSVGRVQ